MSSAQHYHKIDRVRVKEKIVEPFVPAYQVILGSLMTLSGRVSNLTSLPLLYRLRSTSCVLTSRRINKQRTLKVVLPFRGNRIAASLAIASRRSHIASVSR